MTGVRVDRAKNKDVAVGRGEGGLKLFKTSVKASQWDTREPPRPPLFQT